MKKNLILVGFAIVFAFILAANPTFAASEIVYDALPSVSPDTSYPSQAFQAQQTFEFGDFIHLDGTNRILDKVTVTMVTWAKFADYSSNPLYMNNAVSWTHPITLNIYSSTLDANGVPSQLLGTVTQNITIPWRPAASEACGAGLQWMDGLGRCNNGYAFNAAFDMSSLGVVLPDDIIVSVAYNTQSYGEVPMVVTGPYNSLNVAVPANQAVAIGSDDSSSEVFWNTITAAWYTDAGAAGSGILRKDTNWAPYGTVALKVEATSPFIRSASIISPAAGAVVSGNVSFAAILNDKDVNDSVQWAVRQGTCAAGTNTVFGNVDGHNDTFFWNGTSFHALTNVSTWADGGYCFIFNPTESAGDTSIRETREFVVSNPPIDVNQCKKGAWKNFSNPTFENQGQCVSYVQSNINAGKR